MKYDVAVEGLYSLMRGVQKARSNSAEATIFDYTDPEDVKRGEAFLAELEPWLWGEKSLLIPILRIVDRIEAGGEMERMEWFNLCYVAFNLAPSIMMVWSFMHPNIDQFRPNFGGMTMTWEDE